MAESVSDFEREIRLKERRRCVGIMLAEYAIQKAGGREACAAILDALATKIEHPDE